MPMDHIRAALERPEEGARGFRTGVTAIRRTQQAEPGPSTRVTSESSSAPIA